MIKGPPQAGFHFWTAEHQSSQTRCTSPWNQNGGHHELDSITEQSAWPEKVWRNAPVRWNQNEATTSWILFLAIRASAFPDKARQDVPGIKVRPPGARFPASRASAWPGKIPLSPVIRTDRLLGNCYGVTKHPACSMVRTFKHGQIPAIMDPSAVTKWPWRCSIPLRTGLGGRSVRGRSSTSYRVKQSFLLPKQRISMQIFSQLIGHTSLRNY